MNVLGVVLAAGAGSRYGFPKALATDAHGRPWLVRCIDELRLGGVVQTAVVLGAQAELARDLVPTGTSIVEAPDWSLGLSRSLCAALAFAEDTEADAVLITLVDMPGVNAQVISRLMARDNSVAALQRASYRGKPRHPVKIGRAHWSEIVASATSDQGARSYLRAHLCELIECADIGHGADVDSP